MKFRGFLGLSTVDTWSKNNSLFWGSCPVQECLAAFLNSIHQMPGAPSPDVTTKMYPDLASAPFGNSHLWVRPTGQDKSRAIWIRAEEDPLKRGQEAAVSETEGLKQAGVGRGDKRKRVGRPGRVLRRERLAVWGKVATFKKPVFSKDQSSSAATGLLSWP